MERISVSWFSHDCEIYDHDYEPHLVVYPEYIILNGTKEHSIYALLWESISPSNHMPIWWCANLSRYGRLGETTEPEVAHCFD